MTRIDLVVDIVERTETMRRERMGAGESQVNREVLSIIVTRRNEYIQSTTHSHSPGTDETHTLGGAWRECAFETAGNKMLLCLSD